MKYCHFKLDYIEHTHITILYVVISIAAHFLLQTLLLIGKYNAGRTAVLLELIIEPTFGRNFNGYRSLLIKSISKMRVIANLNGNNI